MQTKRDEREPYGDNGGASEAAAINGARPNTTQLRGAMRSGRTPSLSSAHDPAAAPFDTDDEAAGTPAQAAAVEQALAHEGRSPAPTSAAGARAGLPGGVWIVAALLVAVVLLWLIVF